MYRAGYYEEDDPVVMYQQMVQRGGMRGAPKRFDEYYRCYPTVMFRGPDREELEYGGKILMPPSALEKLTRLHITYPMLFELINGQKDRTTHCGVLEFIAEEGKLYLPNWMMQTLLLDTGDLVQIKSTDLPSASLVKLQPQSTNFLEITDPKAVLEKTFRNFATLTKGDMFSFKYNDTVYSVDVLEVKPETRKFGVSMLETDVSVDFAPPVGYVEPQATRASGRSTPQTLPAGGVFHHSGTMAQAINYAAIAPSSTNVLINTKAVSPNFLLGGQKLNAKKNTKVHPLNSSMPGAGNSTNTLKKASCRPHGPQPLRLPPNQLFFGYEIKPVKRQADVEKENSQERQPKFEGAGNTLRGGKRKEEKAEGRKPAEKKVDAERRLDGKNVK